MGTEYIRAYRAAATELEGLLAQQEKIEDRIFDLRKTLNSLSNLCRQEGTEPRDLNPSFGRLEQIIEGSLTDDIVAVLNASDEPLTTTEIRKELDELGESLADHKNPLASINAVLARLVESGRAKPASKEGRNAWTKGDVGKRRGRTVSSLCREIEMRERRKKK